MDQHYASATPQPDSVSDEVQSRMQRVDSLVRPWVDPAFRARINPDVPEVVGPPGPVDGQRLRRI